MYNGKGSLGADRRRRDGGESGDLTLQGKAVVLAAGSATRSIPGFGVDGSVVMTSDEVLSMPKLPGSAVVIGGGAIGCEFASMMGDLGTEVTILEALPQILNGCDADAAEVERSFKKRGITTRTGVMVNGHTPKPDGSGTTVHFGDGESVESTPLSCRSAAAPSPICSASRARGSASMSVASSRSTSAVAPPNPACGRSAIL